MMIWGLWRRPMEIDRRAGCLIGFSLLPAVCKWCCLFGAVDQLGQSTSRYLSAALLAIAGVSVFTCERSLPVQMPRAADLFMQYFGEGAWRNGLRLGLVCLDVAGR